VGSPAHINVPATRQQAAKFLPRIRKVPGVLKAHYAGRAGTISVYLDGSITLKQRNHVVQLMGKAANS
jgi:hypothetical protein